MGKKSNTSKSTANKNNKLKKNSKLIKNSKPERNSKHLKFAGIIEIVAGLAALAAIRGLLGPEVSENFSHSDAWFSFLGLGGSYIVYSFVMLAGLFGVLLAEKNSPAPVIFGLILILIQIIQTVQSQGNTGVMIANSILLLLPLYYFYHAFKLYRNR